MLKRLIQTPLIIDDCKLCVIEGMSHVPFDIKRVYHISGADSALPRGAHAHHQTKQVLFCIQGTIIIKLDNGKKKEEVFLDKPNVGIFLDKLVWHTMESFQPETILLVVASDIYKEVDYIRDYQEFLSLIKKNSK